MVDSLAAFPGIQNQHDSSRMEAALASLRPEGITIPAAFNVLFFKEKACELIRFRLIDEYVLHVSVGGFIQNGMFTDQTCVQDLLMDVTADAFKCLLQGCTVDNDGAVENYVLAEHDMQVLE